MQTLIHGQSAQQLAFPSCVTGPWIPLDGFVELDHDNLGRIDPSTEDDDPTVNYSVVNDTEAPSAEEPKVPEEFSVSQRTMIIVISDKFCVARHSACVPGLTHINQQALR